jgi:undecaprenyl-diphosphatase
MDSFSAIIYGVIQGFAEFIPVSSSGHLALLPHFLKIEDPGVVFDLIMHLGTAFAVILYFRKEVFLLITSFFRLFNFFRGRKVENCELINNMLISTVVTFVFAILFKAFASSYGRNKYAIAFNLIFWGLLMFIADRKKYDERAKIQLDKSLRPKMASFIGLFQGLAIFPGVSRSGSTLTISRMLGLSRKEASRYSFLLSLPVILGGIILELPKIDFNEASFTISSCVIGGLTSFFVGLLTIHLFLKIIERLGLGVFSLYRFLLGILVILFL